MVARRVAVVLALVGACRPPPTHETRLQSASVVVLRNDFPDDAGADAAGDVGVELRLATARARANAGQGHGWGMSWRLFGGTQELALSAHLFEMTRMWGARGFVRGHINLIELDVIDGDVGVGFLGPTLELGLTNRKRGGECLVASISRDLRLGHRDETFVGIGFGWCVANPYHPIK